MFYITGDTHRDFGRIEDFCAAWHTTKDDVLIILGDAGINYFGEPRDRLLKQGLAALPITLFCVHGNHERRPGTISSYSVQEWHGGKRRWTAFGSCSTISLLFQRHAVLRGLYSDSTTALSALSSRPR